MFCLLPSTPRDLFWDPERLQVRTHPAVWEGRPVRVYGRAGRGRVFLQNDRGALYLLILDRRSPSARPLPALQEPILDGLAHPHRGFLLVVGAQGEAAIVDDGGRLHWRGRYKGPPGGLLAAWHPHVPMLALAEPGRLRVWHPAPGMQTFELKEDHPHQMAWSPDGQVLAIAGRHLRLWSVDRGFLPGRAFPEDRPVAWHLNWAPRGAHLAAWAPTYRPRLWLWTPRGWHRAQGLPRYGEIQDLLWAPHGHALVGILPWQGLRVWDARGQRLRDLPFPLGEGDITAAWSPDGRFLLEGQAFRVRLWGFPEFVPFAVWQGERRMGYYRKGPPAWSPEGSLVSMVLEEWTGSHPLTYLLLQMTPGGRVTVAPMTGLYASPDVLWPRAEGYLAVRNTRDEGYYKTHLFWVNRHGQVAPPVTISPGMTHAAFLPGDDLLVVTPREIALVAPRQGEVRRTWTLPRASGPCHILLTGRRGWRIQGDGLVSFGPESDDGR